VSERIGARVGDESIRHLREILAPQPSGSTVDNARFAVVPLSHRDVFLVPLETPAVARRSLTEYSALRSIPKRVVRYALGESWRVRLPEVVLRRRATLPTGAGTLIEHLCSVLAEPRLTFATGLRRVGSFYTPVLQLFRPDGTPIAYAKIGWDGVTGRQVRAESDALRLVTTAEPTLFRAPALLYAGRWQHLELSVTAPLPPDARRVPSSHLPPVLALREVAALDGPVKSFRLQDAPWWQRISDEAPGFEIQAPGLSEALARLQEEAGDVVLPFGRWHGDWAEWNMALAAGRLHVWDWEYSRPDVPFGLDLLQFFFQQYFVVEGQPLVPAALRAAEDAAPGLKTLGLGRDEQSVLTRLQRLEHRLRAERAVRAGAEPDPHVRDTPIFTLL
jgi:hypothetical protein